MVRVLILKSGAPHQSQAPSSEIRGGKSSDLKIRGAPSAPISQAPSSEFQGGKSSDLKKAGAPHDSPRLHPRSSRVVRVLIKKKKGRTISPRVHPRRSGVVRVLI